MSLAATICNAQAYLPNSNTSTNEITPLYLLPILQGEEILAVRTESYGQQIFLFVTLGSASFAKIEPTLTHTFTSSGRICKPIKGDCKPGEISIVVENE